MNNVYHDDSKDGMYHHALTLWADPRLNVLQLIGFNRVQTKCMWNCI